MSFVSDLEFRISDLVVMVEELKYTQLQVFGVEDEPTDLAPDKDKEEEEDDDEDEDEDDEEDEEEEEDGWPN